MYDAGDAIITLTATLSNGDVQDLKAEPKGTLMEALRDAGLVAAVCGGAMACGTCAVALPKPWQRKLPEVEREEASLLDCISSSKDLGMRLSCQIQLDPAIDGLLFHIIDEEG